MQLNENTKKVEQIEKVCKDQEQITQTISDVVEKFDTRSIFKEVDLVKRCGILVSTITTALLILPFLGAASVAALFKSGLNNVGAGRKGAYYDVKNNPKVNWRTLLLLMAKRFQYLVNLDKGEPAELTKKKNQVKAIIFDGSSIEKTGKHIEGAGYVHDHTKNIYILGCKLLVCGFWDGASFIPLDFSLHKETRDKELKKAEKRLAKKKDKILEVEQGLRELKRMKRMKKSLLKEAEGIYQNKPGKTNEIKLMQKQRAATRIDVRIKAKKAELKTQKREEIFLGNEYSELKSNYRYCGLGEKEYQDQFKKARDKSSCGHKRVAEANCSKIDIAIKMPKRSVEHGFAPDYIITDTWFFCQKFLKAVIETGRSAELVSMAKIGTAKYKILPNGKLLNPHQIIALYERKGGASSRKHKARYIQFQAGYQDIRVKIFLMRFGTHGRWRMLVTTGLKISFTKIMEVYKIRWTIEVFFKECKQHLLLGKCQSQDFDAQIADATLSMIRYILLSYYERTHYGMTIGGIFRELSQAAFEENLLADISLYFMELIKIFADRAGIEFIDFYEDLLRNPVAVPILGKMGIDPEKQAA